VTNKSWKDQNGCNDSWPGGHTLSGFVRIYRPDAGTCVPFAYVSGTNTVTTPGTYSYEALHDFGPQTGCTAPTSFSYAWRRDGQSLACSGRSCSFYVTSGNNFSVAVTVGANYSGQILNGSSSLQVNNWVKCPINVTVSGPTTPAAAGNYTYTMSASAGECGGPIVYGWSLWSYDAQTSTGMCGNSPTCTVAFDPAWPFELMAFGTRYWSDGTNSAGMASLSVVAPFSASISGPTQLAYGEWGSWSPALTGGRRPYSWEWYVDDSRAPDSYSLSRSFDPNSSHTIRIVARDAAGNMGQQYITVYTGPGGCAPLRGCEGWLRAPAEPNAAPGPRVKKPTLQLFGDIRRP
jgi:hypothetical protein